MEIVETKGRKSLTLGVWHKPEPSQGASNCTAAKLTRTGAVVMGDTQNPTLAQLGFTGGEWAALVKTAA